MHSSAPQVDAGSVYIEVTTIRSSSHDGVGDRDPVGRTRVEKLPNDRNDREGFHDCDTGTIWPVFDDCPSSY